MQSSFLKIAKEDGRYCHRAFTFVYEGLNYTVTKIAEQPGHVSGGTLCLGLKKLAQEKWGPLSVLVLNSWGLETTRDFGEIVYIMIKNKWMSSQPTDTLEDFDNVFDFKTEFKDNYRFDC